MASAGSVFVDLLLKDSQYNQGWKRATRTTDTSVSNIIGTIGKIAAPLAAAFSVSRIIKISDNFIALESRLKLVAKEGLSASVALDKLYGVAQDNRQPFDEAVSGYVRLAQSLNEYQRSQYDLINISDLLSKTLKISGANAEGAATFYQQFGQAASSDFKAIGQELQTFADQNPIFYGIIRKEAEKAGTTLKKFAQDGKLSFDLVARALQENAATINSQSQAIAGTVGQALTVLNNSFSNYIRTSNDVDVITGKITETILQLGSALDFAKENAITLTTSVGGLIGGLYQMEIAAQEAKLAAYEFLNLPESVIAKQRNYIAGLTEDLDALGAELEARANSISPTPGPSGNTPLPPPQIGDAEGAKKINDLYEKNLRLIQGIGQEQYQYAELVKELNKLQEAGKITEEERFTALQFYLSETQQKTDSTFIDLEAVSKRAAENMQDAFADFLFDPFQDGLDGMLKGFIDVIRRMIAEQAAAQLFGGGFGQGLSGGLSALLGGNSFSQAAGFAGAGAGSYGPFLPMFADGGHLGPGQWGIAGEEGAELIYGGKSGLTIVPQDKMGGGNNYTFYVGTEVNQRDIARLESMVMATAGPGVVEKRVLNAQKRGMQ